MASLSSDERWMRLALQLGQRGLGRVWPNPAVGCVIVKEGRVIGRGYTQPGGRPHGETQALKQAGAGAHGATAYVSLEPCAHHGKTPPCAQALIKAGVSRVVTAIEDPDPRVAGKGHAMLRKAGIRVETGILKDAAWQANLGFFTRITQGRPMVTLKLATTIDGWIATQTGDSQWITGPQARAYVHKLRADHDAIMVGSGTVRADDPDLRVRQHGLQGDSPVRVVLDSKLQTLSQATMLASAAETPIWLCHGPDADIGQSLPQGTHLIACNTNDGVLDISHALRKLGERGITRVFCEGGGKVAASLLRAGLVDRLIVMTAGLVIGGDGRPAIEALNISALNDAPRFELHDFWTAGPDIVSEWRPRAGQP